LNNLISRQNRKLRLLSRRELLRALAGGIAFTGLARLAGALPDRFILSKKFLLPSAASAGRM
jgi:hypothetical protein